MKTTVSRSRASLVMVAGLALLLGGCSSGDNNASEETPTSSPSSSTTAAESPSASASAGASASASGSPTASPKPPVEPGVPSSVPLCTADKLTGSVEDTAGGGAAGSVYRTLVLTNTSTSACSTLGYPGVSYLSVSGSPVGAPAVRSDETPETLVVLQPGQSAGAVLRETRPENYGDACGAAATSGFLVYPPEDTASLTVAHAGNGCSNEEIELLSIARLQAQ